MLLKIVEIGKAKTQLAQAIFKLNNKYANGVTRQAIAELEAGKGRRFETVEAMWVDFSLKNSE